jgi:hypothetical protein
MHMRRQQHLLLARLELQPKTRSRRSDDVFHGHGLQADLKSASLLHRVRCGVLPQERAQA